jgi:BlaI family transcriptional regulator, penicillinase repressor
VAKKSTARLSAGELEIMQMLWRDGELTLAEAQKAFGRPIGYTTMQTRLNRLVEKGVAAKSTHRPARYRAVSEPEDVGARHIDLLLERVCQGSVLPLVTHLLNRRRLSRDDILQLKRLIAEAERANGQQYQ